MFDFSYNLWHDVNNELYEYLNLKSLNIDKSCKIKLCPDSNIIIIEGFKLNDGFTPIRHYLKYDEIFNKLGK